MKGAEPTVVGERPRRQYCFAEFTLDLDCGFLRRHGEEITLSPKAFEVLAFLVEHHGRLVTKTALIEGVWLDTAITDNSLAQRLLEIRRALRDDSQQLIRTVARRGYIFMAPVTAPVVEFPRQPSAGPEPGPLPLAPAARAPQTLKAFVLGAAALVLLVALMIGLAAVRRQPDRTGQTYMQLTNFTDAVVSPALSPDGKMLAFYRSGNWFLNGGPIYVKLLPNGEPVQIAKDPRAKYGLSFSPDGTRVAYTVTEHKDGWKTYTVPSIGGGEPRLLMANSAGPTWLNESRLLFSEIRTGAHMGVVTSAENRTDYRKIYFPHDERGMAHLSYLSPDQKWVLVVEMDPVWQPCRVVPFDGSSSGRQVGPKGKCISAAWSPDGRWMYFSVEVDGSRHLWRQRFPSRAPEQITFGATEEEGLAVAPDGKSLITSIGTEQSAVWIHDAAGDRPLHSEGYAPITNRTGLFGSGPTFSPDGRRLYYLRRQTPEAEIELWRADLASGSNEKVMPSFSILEYEVSSDGREVLFSSQPPGKPGEIWLASLDRSSPPRKVAFSGESSPHFDHNGQVLVRLTEGTTHYLARMAKDGSGRTKLSPYPIGNVVDVSPDGKWLAAIARLPEGGLAATIAVPTDGGAPRRICGGGCPVAWAPDGKYLYVSLTGGAVGFPLRPGEMLPDLPAAGLQSVEESKAFRGAVTFDKFYVYPSHDPAVYAYVKTTIHRNLFRIPLNVR